jgi:hypothetical protein
MVEGWRLFVTVKSLIYLTWQSPLLISEISPELEYHLHIGNFSQFVPLASYLHPASPYYPLKNIWVEMDSQYILLELNATNNKVVSRVIRSFSDPGYGFFSEASLIGFANPSNFAKLESKQAGYVLVLINSFLLT